MAAKRTDLNKRCFFILSGLANGLGKSMAVEMCRRFKAGSVVVLIESSEETLQEVKKEIQYLENNIEVIICPIGDWKRMNSSLCRELLGAIVKNYEVQSFDLAFVLHNEGSGITDKLIEPQNAENWMTYVQENLHCVVALNQEFLKIKQFQQVEKLVVNITSSLLVKPFVYNSLNCSCKNAREMYFRAMADEEGRNGVFVMTYAPGIMDTHVPQFDENNNVTDLTDLDVDPKLLKIPRVTAQQSTLKLINILEEMSFISGHDVDYYDTFFL